VEARVAELVAEEMTLQELRRARKLTQVRMAKKLGVSQIKRQKTYETERKKRS
jgi:DNA-binding XRE family transcriptional regulator